MLEPKVSIIVPIYNCELYLRACIESIINQTYKNLEIILIDDGSTDCSLEICKEYTLKDKRVFVFHQDNKGVSAARNFGIDFSCGEYITFVDSDDELLENCILVLLQDIQFFKADIAAGLQINVSLDGRESVHGLAYTSDSRGVITNKDSLRFSLGFDRRMTSCHGKLFCKKFLNGIRFEEGRKINEDFYFMFICCMRQPVFSYNNECVYKYFYRNDSSSRTVFNEKYFDMIYFADLKKQMIEDYYPELLNEALCMQVSTHLFFLNVICRTKDKKYRKVEKDSIGVVVDNYKNYTTHNKFEKKMAWIVAHRLYPLYKMAVRFKYYR